jgi:hypothetical protein
MYGSIFLLPLDNFNTYTIRPRDYISRDLPPGRRISTHSFLKKLRNCYKGTNKNAILLFD